MGLTTLISGLFGLLSTLMPRVLGLVEGRAQHRREAEFLELQHRSDGKLREAENVQFLEEVRATRAQVVAAIEAGARPRGGHSYCSRCDGSS